MLQNRAGGQARKREARPSPEPLPPGEGRGGTAAMGKSNGQGGGAARSAQREDTAPQDVQHFHVAVGDQRSPDGQARSAWPNKGRGRLACPNPPCVSIAALGAGSRYSERGRGGSVPQLPQAAPDCPQALARSLTSRAGLLRSPAFTPEVVPGTRLDNRMRPASAVPPVRDEMGGAGRPGPVCGGMARDETFNRAAQPGASPRPARVEAGAAGRNRGRGPKGTPETASLSS